MSPPTATQTPGGASAELVERAARVRLLVFDVDGVLTDGGLYYGPEGEALKRFNVKDGHGIVMSRLVGLPSAILTARRSGQVEKRGAELGMVAVLQGHRDKNAGLTELITTLGVSEDAIAYIGDDTNDLGPLSRVVLAACPADAVEEVRRAAHFVTRANGGHGAARELCELVLRARGLWDEALGHMGAPPHAG